VAKKPIRTVKKKKYKPGFGFKSESELFLHIWNTREHKSEVSGTKIYYEVGDEMWYRCFSHILSKGAYPRFRLFPANIMIKTPQEHELYGNTPRSELENKLGWGKVYEKFDELKRAYYA